MQKAMTSLPQAGTPVSPSGRPHQAGTPPPGRYPQSSRVLLIRMCRQSRGQLQRVARHSAAE
jgi:hypothetical protein